MSRARTYLKMILGGTLLCVGGPVLVSYITPTEEELFQKYNPELQKKSLANREQRQQDFDDFATKLKEYSKSNKPIWTVAAEDQERQRQLRAESAASEQAARTAEIEKQKEEIRKSIS
ncbi:MAG: assembly factor cbp4 [Cirrosporium novae-zelandiae]|nr:MAG: assembly factor cbp4 [Cirrosporium novae-zelandiae]